MLGWVGDIERQTLENDTFRTVVFTGDHQQLTVMRLAPGEDIGLEMHPDTDQFLRIESGTARVEFGKAKDAIDETHDVEEDWAIIVSAGTWHNVVNTGDGDVKLYSLYAPPEHPDGTVHGTKADAEAAERR
ncbi:MAG: cupin domain-containing protein [Actinomycetota bacterium]